MNAIRYPPSSTMMSQICCNNSCSLPACPSARLHALNARKARFNRRSSFVIALSPAPSVVSEQDCPDSEDIDVHEGKEEGAAEGKEDKDKDDKEDKDKGERKSDEPGSPEFLAAGSATAGPSTSDFSCFIGTWDRAPVFLPWIAVVYRFRS